MMEMINQLMYTRCGARTDNLIIVRLIVVRVSIRTLLCTATMCRKSRSKKFDLISTFIDLVKQRDRDIHV